MQKVKTLFIGLILLAVTLFVARVYLAPAFPYTHDGENHLARFANYKIAVRELQIPPRIAPVLHNHFGYPVFNYNYPLANILSLPFSFAGISYETTFSMLVVAGLLFGSAGVYRWTGYVTRKRWVQVLVSAFWLTTPFITTTLVFRGNIGEILAYALLPWMFVLVHLLGSKRTYRELVLYAALVSAFLLSHNITVVFAVPILVGYAVSLYGKDGMVWKRAVVPAALSLLATLWFWLPALAEMSAIVVGSAQNQLAYAEHFVSFDQLLASPLRFGYSLPGEIDSFGFKIGFLEIVSIFTAFIFTTFMSFRAKRSAQAPLWRSVAFLSAVGVMSVVLQLALSQPIWESISVFRFMQFPWRWSLFFFTVFSPLLALLLARCKWQVVTLFVVSWLVYVVGIAQLQPADTFTKENIDYEHFTQTTSTQNENMAKDFTFSAIGSWQPTAATLQENRDTTIETAFWNGRQHIYRVYTTEQVTIVEPVMYFPGWRTKVNSQEVTYVDSDEIKGRVAFVLSPGEYQIETEFTQYTPSRIIGNTAGIVAVLAMGVLFFWKKKSL